MMRSRRDRAERTGGPGGHRGGANREGGDRGDRDRGDRDREDRGRAGADLRRPERRAPDSGPAGRRGGQPDQGFGNVTVEDVRRTPTGWRVGDEEVSDLTSAMVLADLLAADLPDNSQPHQVPPPREPRHRRPEPAPDVQQLQETVAQLEHALTVRVRVEQAIGVLAERHRLRPRQAFELLRSAARSRGRRVLEIAGEVVESASNPLLRIPEELARPPAPRRGRLGRRAHGYE